MTDRTEQNFRKGLRNARYAPACIAAVLGATIALSGTARAEGPLDWSGWYYGAHVADAHSSFEDPADAINDNTTMVHNETNATGAGLHAGYNWQRSAWVGGVEVDATLFEGYRVLPRGGGSSMDVSAAFSLRARLGYAMGRALPYVTGGVSAMTVDFDGDTTDDPVFWGYVLGAGLEYALNPAVSVRTEYLYNFGTDEVTGEGGTGDVDLSTHMFRIGVSFKYDAVHGAGATEFAETAASVDWSGFYVGVLADMTNAVVSDKDEDITDIDVNHFGFSGNGIGVYGGYSHQWNRIVAGVEASYTANQVADLIGGTAGFRMELDDTYMVRGRLGYSYGNALPFVTAGVAGGDLVMFDDGDIINNAVGDLVGYTVGAGLDWLIAPHVVARAEYFYTDYGTANYDGGPEEVGLTTHTMRVGLAVKTGDSDPSGGLGGMEEPFNWTGVYAGLHAGSSNFEVDDPDEQIGSGPKFNIDGVAMGGLIGANYQYNSLVFGVEADISHTPFDTWAPSGGDRVEANDMLSVRGRLGYALGNTLLFATAGWATTEIDTNDRDFGRLDFDGFIVGGGFEHAVSRNVVARLEYLYTDFGSELGPDNDPDEVYTPNNQTIRGAVTWLFHTQ
ncbi:outer membrane protein [Tepidamorphus sp. 3E244]|uniref:outer membrane protein n=1 Tax=Tepidamorphus sp. 3E244 TaxID=3385498 RepID=UPI0038FCF281